MARLSGVAGLDFLLDVVALLLVAAGEDVLLIAGGEVFLVTEGEVPLAA